NEFHLLVHDPDVRQRRVTQKAEGAAHQPDKDRRLLSDQQRREGESHQNTQILGAIPDQHFQRDEVHDFHPFSAATENLVMWSARRSTSCGPNRWSGLSRLATWLQWK